jgi:hypothetical protein
MGIAGFAGAATVDLGRFATAGGTKVSKIADDFLAG